MRYAIAFVITVLISTFALADGIPVDRETGKIRVPYTEVVLNVDQIEELHSLGTVTFGSKQWAELRKVAKGIPKRFQNVLAINYSGCTCGMDEYCIALSPDRIAILHTYYDEPFVISGLPDETYPTLLIDSKGQFYYKGVLVPFPALLEAVAKPPSEYVASKNEERRICVELPPLMKRTDPALKSRMDELYAQATKAGWKVYDSDYSVQDCALDKNVEKSTR